MNARPVIDLLIDQGVIDQGQADEALQEIGTSGKDVVQTLVDFGYVTEESLYHAIAESLGTDVVDLAGFEGDRHIVERANCRKLHHDVSNLQLRHGKHSSA